MKKFFKLPLLVFLSSGVALAGGGGTPRETPARQYDAVLTLQCLGYLKSELSYIYLGYVETELQRSGVAVNTSNPISGLVKKHFEGNLAAVPNDAELSGLMSPSIAIVADYEGIGTQGALSVNAQNPATGEWVSRSAAINLPIFTSRDSLRMTIDFDTEVVGYQINCELSAFNLLAK